MRLTRKVNPTSDTVVVATGAGFADALCIGPWAWKTASPILLALPDGTLRSDAAEAIKADAGIKRIVIVGGPSVVSDAIKDRLGDGYTYERIGDADRYETSIQVAAWSAERGLGFSRPIVATGKGYADALAAASVCGKHGSALLLADSATAPTVEVLKRHKSSVERAYVAGGESAMPASLSDAIAQASGRQAQTSTHRCPRGRQCLQRGRFLVTWAWLRSCPGVDAVPCECGSRTASETNPLRWYVVNMLEARADVTTHGRSRACERREFSQAARSGLWGHAMR